MNDTPPLDLDALRRLCDVPRPLETYYTGSGQLTAEFERDWSHFAQARKQMADAVPALLDRLEAAEQDRDDLAAQVQGLNRLLIDAWNDGEHANFCPIDFGEDTCLCWRSAVDAYIQSLPKPSSARTGTAEETS